MIRNANIKKVSVFNLWQTNVLRNIYFKINVALSEYGFNNTFTARLLFDKLKWSPDFVIFTEPL